MYIGFHVKCRLFLSDFNKNSNFLDRFLKDTDVLIFIGSRVVLFGRTDGQKDTTKLILAFRNFANAPKNGNKTNKA